MPIKTISLKPSELPIMTLSSLNLIFGSASRQLLARFSVTEAKDTDYYWNNSWKIGSPDWLVRASFVEPRGVITRYWDNEWKNYMSRYFQGIIKSGYDGAFLTGLENHRYFENLTPLE